MSSEPKPAWHIIPFVPAGSRSGKAGQQRADDHLDQAGVRLPAADDRRRASVQFATVPAGAFTLTSR